MFLASVSPSHFCVFTGEFDRQVHVARKLGNRVGFLPKLGASPGSLEESLEFSVQGLSKLSFWKHLFAAERLTAFVEPLNRGMELGKSQAKNLSAGLISIVTARKA